MVVSKAPLTKEDKAFIEANSSKYTARELASILKTDRRKVYLHCYHYDLPYISEKVKKPFTKEEQKFILENYNKMSVHAISKKIKRNDERVREFLLSKQIKVKRRIKNDSIFSSTELGVVELIAKGYTIKEIAEKNCVSCNTVKTHVVHCYDKLESIGIQRHNFVTLSLYYWENIKGHKLGGLEDE